MKLTSEDLAFLRRPLYGFFTVAAGAEEPQPRPVWFEATDIGVRCGDGSAVVRGPALALCGALVGRRALLDLLSGDGRDVLAARI